MTQIVVENDPVTLDLDLKVVTFNSYNVGPPR